MNLVIVESPTKTKSLSKYLGSGFEVLASMGHIRDLPKSKTGVGIKKKGKNLTFVPEYVVDEKKKAQISKLKTAAKKAEKIILATDPDREGEAIAYHVAELLKGDQRSKIKDQRFQRITFHAITKEAILEALEKPHQVDMDLVNAQQARRILDRLVGYKLSPVLWKKVRRGLSAGRVQSVAVRLIVEREREIEKFKPDEYWELRVKVEGLRDKTETFWVELMKIEGKAAKLKTGEQVAKIEAQLKKADYVVDKVVRKERRALPHPPFKTSTLQQAAANVLGWSAKKTMSVAQSLYEQGSITYHRTDSLNLAPEAINKIREFIGKEFGNKYLPERAIFYKTSGKVVAQEAHEAIRPANMDVGTNTFKGEGKMAADQDKLYGLIWRRTIACQMVPAVYDTTTVDVTAGVYLLRATGEIMKFDGWRKLYKKFTEEEVVILPEVTEGEKLDYKDLKSEQKFTLPPPRFNDASLVKELEKRGIGRPSTYASIISTIIDRGYVNREQRKFFATSVGMAVTDFLIANFPTELDYDFTAEMEDKLDEIARGKLDWNQMLSDFYGPFEKTVEQAESQETKRVEVPVEKTGKACPDCKEGEIVIREGRFGKFYSCSRFPECKYTAKLIVYFEGAVCPKDGGRIVIKKTRFGKPFYGCENYPKCDWASWGKPTDLAGGPEVEGDPTSPEATQGAAKGAAKAEDQE